MDSEIKNKVLKAIDSVRPYLEADGGDVSLIDISKDLVVKVKFLGSCQGCPFNVQTLKAGIEQAIKRELPQVKEVIAVSE